MFCQPTQYLKMVRTNENMAGKCQTIMWILGQGGIHDFKAGLRGNNNDRLANSAEDLILVSIFVFLTNSLAVCSYTI